MSALAPSSCPSACCAEPDDLRALDRHRRQLRYRSVHGATASVSAGGSRHSPTPTGPAKGSRCRRDCWRPGIRLEAATFAYPGSDDAVALGPVELELPAGRTVALVGERCRQDDPRKAPVCDVCAGRGPGHDRRHRPRRARRGLLAAACRRGFPRLSASPVHPRRERRARRRFPQSRPRSRTWSAERERARPARGRELPDGLSTRVGNMASPAAGGSWAVSGSGLRWPAA